jgi:methyltransferase (TIGR00027 family)
MSEPLIQHVSDTAFLVAHHRAVESARSDALFRDPLAGRLAGDKGAAIARNFPVARMSEWSVAVRTVIIDDFLRAALARGVDLVVNLGAGLDTRPYRLELPATLTWVEVDYPPVVSFKEERLQAETPRCRLERVGLDLADRAARQALFARLDTRATRILVLTEGVVPYLEVAEAATLADDLRAVGRVDSWIVDYFSPEVHAQRRRSDRKGQLANAHFKFQPPDWFGFFAAHGWRTREARYLPEVGATLHRPPPLPRAVKVMMTLLRPFVPAEKRGRFSRFAGYMLMEPAPR